MERLLKNNSLLKIVNNYIYDSYMPLNLNYWYNFGSLLGFFLIVQIVSGIFLAMNYIPHVDLAFDSIEYIMREVPYGYIIRYTHANGAALFFVFVYLHIARALLYGSYNKVLTWSIGVIIFLLMIITAFIGYSLVFGQMSYWAIAVITNLLTVIPYVGHDLVQFIYGGFNIGGPTLTRFFSLHYLLPFIIAALSLAHLITLHQVGGSSPLGLNSVSGVSLINFHPYYSFKDLLGFVIASLLLIFLVFFYPNLLGHSDNYIPANPMVTPTHIVPEFYLLPFYALLRSIPNKTLGVLALLSAILVLLIIPYIHLGLIHTAIFRPVYKVFLYVFFTVFLLLMYLGQAVPSEPFITLGQLLGLYYFGFFLVLIPLISFLETFFYLLFNKN
jgi:quinol-cytochrome oxidoreductase complex cytochrome b subunit